MHSLPIRQAVEAHSTATESSCCARPLMQRNAMLLPSTCQGIDICIYIQQMNIIVR